MLTENQFPRLIERFCYRVKIASDPKMLHTKKSAYLIAFFPNFINHLLAYLGVLAPWSAQA